MDKFFTKPLPFFCPSLDERIKEIANAEIVNDTTKAYSERTK